MARPSKIGLDYFELDCLLDDSIKLIQAEFGLKGFAVIVKLYQKIYGTCGYYCEWNEDVLLLFMSENGLGGDSKNLINEIIAACIKRNIFSEKLFNEFNILTSSGVQKRYLNATSKREKVYLKKEYLLISVGKNSKNVVINPISVVGNSIDSVGNTQRREEKSKEDNKNNVQSALALFESLWKLYPNKKGKAQISESKKTKLLAVGFDEMKRAIERYSDDLKKEDWRKPQNGSTFFNSGYIDYLDANYEPNAVPVVKQKQNKFNDFNQRSYDFSELETYGE